MAAPDSMRAKEPGSVDEVGESKASLSLCFGDHRTGFEHKNVTSQIGEEYYEKKVFHRANLRRRYNVQILGRLPASEIKFLAYKSQIP